MIIRVKKNRWWEWHTWFAWHPVVVGKCDDYYDVVWLRTITRRGTGVGWEYRINDR
jgi:hypothetical protein